MAEKLKNLFFTHDSIRQLADSIFIFYPAFDKDKFLKLIYDDTWEKLELKAKMRHTTHCLYKCLPENYLEALLVLIKAAPEIKGFEAMTLPDYIELYGMQHWEESLNALGQFTRYASSEFAIRPYLNQNPELVMFYMMTWAESAYENVRRFASEGCRPRLPWAMILPKFIVDPNPVIKVLEKLKDDPSLFVRKSVANNLNDISKDHPELVLDIAERWYGKSARTDWIVKHALRTLLKQGNKRALALFGFGDHYKLMVKNFSFDKKAINKGETLTFSFDMVNAEFKIRLVRIEYAIDFVKASGKSSRKVFQITEKEFTPGTHFITKRHAFIDLSTRKHYSGPHKFSIIVNGEVKGEKSIVLL